jgi:AraC-like DNA-binding protein
MKPNDTARMKLYIKNMVCSRCKMVVKSELEKLGLHPVSVELGEVEIQENNIGHIKSDLLYNLQSLGFDLIDDKKSKTIEKIKSFIIDLVQNKNNQITINLSDYLVQQLTQDYSKLSNLFSEVEGITIEKYFINQKIEKVKELLMYDEMTLNEISFLLNYSSVAHLSNQFKKVTGFSPSYFKQLKDKKRKQIEDL